jgi:hypothetical protein
VKSLDTAAPTSDSYGLIPRSLPIDRGTAVNNAVIGARRGI